MFSIFKKKKVIENNEKKEKNDEKENYSMKILLLGDGGKTSLCRRFTENKFYPVLLTNLSKKILFKKIYRCSMFPKGYYY